MASFVTREEMDTLESEVEGEKLVTRHILEQSRRNGDDIAGIKTRLARVEDKVDQLDRRVDQLDRKIDGLSRSLSAIVAESVRQVFAERDRKR